MRSKLKTTFLNSVPTCDYGVCASLFECGEPLETKYGCDVALFSREQKIEYYNAYKTCSAPVARKRAALLNAYCDFYSEQTKQAQKQNQISIADYDLVSNMRCLTFLRVENIIHTIDVVYGKNHGLHIYPISILMWYGLTTEQIRSISISDFDFTNQSIPKLNIVLDDIAMQVIREYMQLNSCDKDGLLICKASLRDNDRVSKLTQVDMAAIVRNFNLDCESKTGIPNKLTTHNMRISNRMLELRQLEIDGMDLSLKENRSTLCKCVGVSDRDFSIAMLQYQAWKDSHGLK